MKNRLIFFLCFISLLTAPGCWDVRDINNTAFAISIGIDKPKMPSTAEYKVTLEFAEPVSGKAMPKSLVASAEGSSILEAIQQIQTSISRTISFSHLRVLVVGEKIAKDIKFDDLSSYLMKKPDVAWRLRLLFIQGEEAQAILKVKPQYSELVGAELVAMGQLQQELALVRTNHFYTFWLDLKKSKGTALGSRAYLEKGQGKLIRDGAAVYKNGKLKAWLNANEAKAANWLIEEARTVVVAKNGKNKYTYQVSGLKRQVVPKFEGEKLTFLVKINTNGMVMEESGENLDFSKQKNLKKMEALFQETIKRQVESAINKSQYELKTDYLGFGKALKQQEPETFNSLNWKEVFSSIPIQVDVNCKVKASGLQS